MSKSDSPIQKTSKVASIDTGKKAVSPVPAKADKQGRAVSFLTQKNNQTDKACGEIAPGPKQPYVQPDEEKESGGEG
jgi:hypothetical protein